MTLPRRIPKASKRTERWKSQAHRNFVRSHACCACGSTVNIEVAHVRTGTDGAMSKKPSDYWTISLCGGPDGCHARQHQVGEPAFEKQNQIDMKVLAMEFAQASPKRREIEEALREA